MLRYIKIKKYFSFQFFLPFHNTYMYVMIKLYTVSYILQIIVNIRSDQCNGTFKVRISCFPTCRIVLLQSINKSHSLSSGHLFSGIAKLSLINFNWESLGVFARNVIADARIGVMLGEYDPHTYEFTRKLTSRIV